MNAKEKSRVVEQKGSPMSGFTCFSRACAARERDEYRGPDYLAEVFLPLKARILLVIPALTKWIMRRMFAPGIHEYVLARTRLFDQAFVDALDRGLPQIVLFGAGMDTRALRFQDRNKAATVFELDTSSTQRYKLEALKRKRIALPRSLVFVPIDFNKQSIAHALSSAGYRAGRTTLFLGEGVMMYLEPEAVDQTLDFVRSSAAEGSQFVFDYLRASVLRHENRLHGEQGSMDAVARTGERWTFGIEDGAIEGFLAERGFRMLSHYGASDLEAAYLDSVDGGRSGRINETHNIVVAGF